jgi:hypothetical protein
MRANRLQMSVIGFPNRFSNPLNEPESNPPCSLVVASTARLQPERTCEGLISPSRHFGCATYRFM